MQFDEVWATDFNGLIYQWDNYGQAFHQVTGSLQSVVIGEGYSPCHQYEVWGANINHEVYRYNYCTFGWDSIPGFLGNLAVGGGEVWALNGYNQVFRYNFSTNQFDLMPGNLTQISVGAGGVWGTYTDQYGNASAWQFDPSTQNWQQLPGPMNALVAGSDGVFGFYDNWPDGPMTAYRLNASTRTWTQVYTISGAWTDIGQIAVGTGAGTWMEVGLTGATYYYLSF
jgi:Tectonin domain